MSDFLPGTKEMIQEILADPLVKANTQPCPKSCSVCEGEPHHWLEDCADWEDIPGAANPDQPILRCAHCSVIVPMPEDWPECYNPEYYG